MIYAERLPCNVISRIACDWLGAVRARPFCDLVCALQSCKHAVACRGSYRDGFRGRRMFQALREGKTVSQEGRERAGADRSEEMKDRGRGEGERGREGERRTREDERKRK